MKRSLQLLNLIGVLALAALCVAQWRRDRQLNLQVNQLKQARQDQQQKLAHQEKLTRAATEDSASFKEQFHRTHTNWTETRKRLREMEREHLQLIRERDELKTSVTNWARAVAIRDDQLKVAEKDLRTMSSQLNDSVQKFNELATNYNASVRRFNELATNYNAVVKELNELRTHAEAKPPAPVGAARPN